jgi:hypothetical protein
LLFILPSQTSPLSQWTFPLELQQALLLLYQLLQAVALSLFTAATSLKGSQGQQVGAVLVSRALAVCQAAFWEMGT